jgi:hypothetical protein
MILYRESFLPKDFDQNIPDAMKWLNTKNFDAKTLEINAKT